MKISRKEFIKKSALISSVIFGIPILSSCSASSGRTPVAIEHNDGEIIIKVKKLINIGDSLILEVKNFESKIILFKTGKYEYKAFSLLCSHKGCELVVNENFFECPCHGSEFDIDGNVLKGPASEPLVKFKTKLNSNDTITIFVNEYD